jgi:hypothetical protein
MMLISMQTNSGALNMMVPSKMGWGVAGGGVISIFRVLELGSLCRP